jgi:hypothetical protein
MKSMTLDDRLADLRTAIDAEIRRARSSAIENLLRRVTQIRTASNDADRAAAFEDAAREYAADPAVLEFLKTLAPPAAREEKDLRAQRFARVRVAEIQLYHAAQMNGGRASRDVYRALKSQMDSARDAYREKFLAPVNRTADYLHAEFVRTLANDDAVLLGPEYPGPLV